MLDERRERRIEISVDDRASSFPFFSPPFFFYVYLFTVCTGDAVYFFLTINYFWL